MEFFDIENIAFSVFGYDLSYIELIGTSFGFISVILAARANILTWPAGIINEVAFFSLFFQVQLYSDMYLQVFFFGATVYGWYYWRNQSGENTISILSGKWRLRTILLIVLMTILTGYFMSQIHIFFPQYFNLPAAYPYLDALTTICSIFATILLSRKVIETWILWIIVDIVSMLLYLSKGIYLVSVEYMVFLTICIVGIKNWRKEL